MPEEKTPTQKLTDTGIDAIAQMIAEGNNLRQIAEEIGVSKSYLADWIAADKGRTARARESRQLVAEDADYKAEKILLDLPKDATGAQIAQARELASHYRWRAKAFCPRDYGDKQEIEHKGGVEITTITRKIVK